MKINPKTNKYMNQEPQTPEPVEEQFDLSNWKDITRYQIIEQFRLTKYQVLLIIEMFYYESVSEDSCISFEFPFFNMLNEAGQDFEDIMNNELDKEASITPSIIQKSDKDFVQQFYQTISNLEKLKIVSDWYTNGMFPSIIQDSNGIEVDEFCEMITQSYYEDINEYKNPKNK